MRLRDSGEGLSYLGKVDEREQSPHSSSVPAGIIAAGPLRAGGVCMMGFHAPTGCAEHSGKSSAACLLIPAKPVCASVSSSVKWTEIILAWWPSITHWCQLRRGRWRITHAAGGKLLPGSAELTYSPERLAGWMCHTGVPPSLTGLPLLIRQSQGGRTLSPVGQTTPLVQEISPDCLWSSAS